MLHLWRRLTLVLGDALACYGALVLALTLRRLDFVALGFLIQHLTTFSLLFPSWLLLFHLLGLYEHKRIHDLITLIGDTVLAFVLNLVLAIAAFYLFPKILGITPKTHLVLTALLAHAGAFLWRQALIRLLWPRLPGLRVAFWGDTPLFEEMLADLKRHPSWGYRAVNWPGLWAPPGPEAGEKFWRLEAGAPARLKASMDILVVDPERLEREPGLGRAVLSAAIKDEIPIRTHLDFYTELYRKVPPRYAAQTGWLLSHVLHKKNRLYLLLKRAADGSSAFLGLWLLSPLMLLIALVSKLLDGGSPLYTQKRVGYLGREFEIWKFRTMVTDAERRGPFYRSHGGDGRVTAFGGLLRRFRLDELPQLWNVLVGDMSLVGPRPEWTHEVRILEQKVPHYHLRHLVKPGITGWAQINFRSTQSPRDSLEKLHYDLYYVEKLSPAMDIGILLKTAKRIFQREEAFERKPEPLASVPEEMRPKPAAVGS